MKALLNFAVGLAFLFSGHVTLANEAETVLYGGKIFTGDANHPWATALAIQCHDVIHVGSDADVLAEAPASARRINLGGRLVIPGFNDAHVHIPIDPPGIQLDTGNFIPGPGPDVDTVSGLIAAAAQSSPAGTWLFGV